MLAMTRSKYIILILLFISLVSFNKIVAFNRTKTYYRVPLGPNQRGPEAIAFDCKGQGPYVGISDGRILKWEGPHIRWIEFAVTSQYRPTSCNGVFDTPVEKDCGRPLGLRFDTRTCELYIADSSFGLMKVGPNGGIASLLVNSVDGIPFKFLNGLDVDTKNKVVYFTETSTNYHRWEAGKALSDGDQSGRLMKYDAKTRNVTVLLKDLSFANGVALSEKKDFVLVAETTASQILQFLLTGSKAETFEVFLQLNGRPDNINRDANGDFWIAVIRIGKSIKVNKHGKILETFGGDEIVNNPSDVQDFNGSIWVGFVNQPFIYHT